MRFSERNDITLPHNFMPRNRSGSIWRVIFGFGVALSAMLTLNLVPNLVGGEPEASLLSLVAISVLCFYVVYLKQQNLDLVLQTEFQNLLFANAASAGSLFCAFVKRDGEIVYLHPFFYTMFTANDETPITNLSSMLAALSALEPSAETLQDAVFSLDVTSFEIQAIGPHEHPIRLMLEITPLTRPAGYAVLKAIPVSSTHPSVAD